MISVVIPTLDAAETLPRCLAALAAARARGLVGEVIVADGGSADATVAIAESLGTKIVHAERGRGGQLAAGAEAARGDWLLFLHADTVLEPGWDRQAADFIQGADPSRAAYFRFALDDGSAAARRLERLVALRCRLFALPYGDQGLLISRAFYQMTGGYRQVPLMEDVDLVRRVGRKRLTMLSAAAVTGAQRFRKDGYCLRSARNLTILALYACRMPVGILAKLYR
jgi:rSAM/selenodomain-associated transferase 2